MSAQGLQAIGDMVEEPVEAVHEPQQAVREEREYQAVIKDP